jgi:acyl-coenzyme A thioesterase PaaI-like protein
MAMGEVLSDGFAAPRCFCCGSENPSGLKLRFTKESDDGVSTTFEPPEDWTGWGRILHGGFQSLLLDETTSWAAYGALGERSFVTRRIALRFLRPVHVGQPLTIVGKVVEDRGRTILVHGEIRDPAGQLLTEAEAELQRLDAQAMRVVIGEPKP